MRSETGWKMTHLYDTEEPNVISQDLLKRSVLVQGPDGEAGRLAKEEGIEFIHVRHLRLDFQNILRIENLWQFSNLTKLQLDNNIIEKIEGLDTLVNLEWLDLSFNNISEVGDGLKGLSKLRDLSLAHNQLTEITGFNTLHCLQSLSLTSNRLHQLDQVCCLRPMSNLQTLCLSGNPLAKEDNYQSYCIAFIPSLVYLDFIMVFPDERETACSLFTEDLTELEMSEREAQRKKEERDTALNMEETYKAAYVDGLQGTSLYDAMFIEDGDSERIALLPGVKDMLTRMKEGFVESSEHLTKVGLEEKIKRDEELAIFHQSHQQACTQSQQRSVDIVTDYEENKVTSGEEALAALEHDLMKEEMILVEQLDEIIKDFDRNYSDLIGSFLESVQSHMTQMRELENGHHEKVTEIGLQYLENCIKGTLEEEPPDNLRKLLPDKDTLVSALNTTHDNHLLSIDSREDDITHRSKADLAHLLETISEAELTRNRHKVTEITQYIAWQERNLREVS